MQELVRPLDRLPGIPATKVGSLSRVLQRVATAFGLFILASDATLHVESVPPQRRSEAAKRHLGLDGDGVER